MTLEHLLNNAKNVAASTAAAYMILATPAYGQEVRYADSVQYKHEVVEYQGTRKSTAPKATPKKSSAKPAPKPAPKQTEKKQSSTLDSVLGTIGTVLSKPFRGIYEGAVGASQKHSYGAPKHAKKSPEKKPYSQEQKDFDSLPPEIRAALRAGHTLNKTDTEVFRYERTISLPLRTQDGRVYGPMAVTPPTMPAVPTQPSADGAEPKYTERVEELPGGGKKVTRTYHQSISSSSPARTEVRKPVYDVSVAAPSTITDIVRRCGVKDAVDSSISVMPLSFNYGTTSYPESMLIASSEGNSSQQDVAVCLGNKQTGVMLMYFTDGVHTRLTQKN
jgi:hypothetical protein